jgi:hypothetical protein
MEEGLILMLKSIHLEHGRPDLTDQKGGMLNCSRDGSGARVSPRVRLRFDATLLRLRGCNAALDSSSSPDV